MSVILLLMQDATSFVGTRLDLNEISMLKISSASVFKKTKEFLSYWVVKQVWNICT